MSSRNSEIKNYEQFVTEMASFELEVQSLNRLYRSGREPQIFVEYLPSHHEYWVRREFVGRSTEKPELRDDYEYICIDDYADLSPTAMYWLWRTAQKNIPDELLIRVVPDLPRRDVLRNSAAWQSLAFASEPNFRDVINGMSMQRKEPPYIQKTPGWIKHKTAPMVRSKT